MSTREAWRAYAAANPITSTLVLIAIGFNALTTLALLSVGRFGDALDPGSRTMLFVWILLLLADSARLRQVRR